MSEVIIYTTYDGVVNKHVQAIYDDQELEKQATVNQELTVQTVGYRVRSPRGVQLNNLVSAYFESKAKPEYQKYKAKTLDAVEQDYLKTIPAL